MVQMEGFCAFFCLAIVNFVCFLLRDRSIPCLFVCLAFCLFALQLSSLFTYLVAGLLACFVLLHHFGIGVLGVQF